MNHAKTGDHSISNSSNSNQSIIPKNKNNMQRPGPGPNPNMHNNADYSVDRGSLTGRGSLLHTGKISPPSSPPVNTGTAGLLGGTSDKHIADSGSGSGLEATSKSKEFQVEGQTQDKVQDAVQVPDKVQIQAQVQQGDAYTGTGDMRKQEDDNDDDGINNKEDDDGTGINMDKEEEDIETEAIDQDNDEDVSGEMPALPESEPATSKSKSSRLLAEAAKAANRPLKTRDPEALAHLLKTKRSQRGRKSDPRMEIAVVA